MATLTDTVNFLDALLDAAVVPADKSNNGLQVAGRTEVKTVVGGVDGCLQLYQAAAARQADLVFVHHGESWGGGIRRVTGHVTARLSCLLRHGLSLYASHLPLDAHPELGHNRYLADALELCDQQPFAPYCGVPVGVCGTLPEPLTGMAITAAVDVALDSRCHCFGDPQRALRRVGIVAGSGGEAVLACEAVGVDVLITGEFLHSWFHPAAELGVTVITAGHYKSECPGVRAVLARLAVEFDVACEFVDLPTGL